MISWMVVLIGLAMSFYYADLSAENQLYSLWAPLSCMVFSVAFFIKLVLSFVWARHKENRSYGVAPSSGGFDDGGGGGD